MVIDDEILLALRDGLSHGSPPIDCSIRRKEEKITTWHDWRSVVGCGELKSTAGGPADERDRFKLFFLTRYLPQAFRWAQ